MMTDGLQSILAALGSAVINSFWQTGLLWLLVLIYTRFHKKLLPQHLSAISFWALISGFAAFVFSFIFALTHPGEALSILSQFTTTYKLHSLLEYAAIAYVLLLLIPLVQLGRGIQSVYSLRRKGLGRVPGTFKIFLLDICQYLNIKRKVKVYTSTFVTSPITIGFLKPIILLPVALVNQLSLIEVEAILLHELAHIKRNDYLQNFITQIILTLLYFNPFARLLANMQNLEREKTADNRVLQFEYNNRMYAQTLLFLAKQNVHHANPLAVSIATNQTPLLERIEFLFGKRKRRYPSFKNIITSCTFIITIAFLSSLHSKKDTPSTGLKSIAQAQPEKAIQFASTNEAGKNNKSTPKIVYQSSIIVTQNNVSAKAEPSKEEKEFIEQDENLIDKTATPVFASHLETATPELKTGEEKNVQQAIKATQKIVIELSWNIIEQTLAETVTQQEKEALKEAYAQKMETANWDKHANLLRLRYQNINWDETYTKLAMVIANIKMDSIYKEYKITSQKLNGYKKQLEQDSSYQQKEIEAISHLLLQYKTAIQKMDSTRGRKIVEL